ncbi:MAG: DNA-3-methyladenine glycosylase 2 family protein [Gorillibacterium sp.]|nr:DNA-3-methyladenine glycosylase 2 family protein [Gorillibacterium sp.]
MSRSPFECLYRLEADGVNRLMRLGGVMRLIRITCPTKQMMRVELLQGEPLSEEIQCELASYVRDWFDLERNLEPFYRMANADPLLSPLLKSFYGLRLVGIPDLFEALCWAIVGQQVNLTFAYKLKQRLTEEFGEACEWEGITYHAFPVPERFRDVTMEQLCSLQLTKNKARSLLEVARIIASGELTRDNLLALNNPKAAEIKLTAIRGIGPWTAHYVRMRCLRDLTAFLIADVGLHNAIKHVAGLERKPTIVELQTLFAHWQGWEAYATFYLWRVLY